MTRYRRLVLTDDLAYIRLMSDIRRSMMSSRAYDRETAAEVLAIVFYFHGLRAAECVRRGADQAAVLQSRVLCGLNWLEELEALTDNKKSKDRSIAVRGWAHVVIDDVAKEAILTNKTTIEELMFDVASLVTRGFRFSVTYDDYSSAIQVTLVCGEEDSRNLGYAVSARHVDFDVAIRTLFWKVDQMGDEDWSTFVTAPSAPSWS